MSKRILMFAIGLTIGVLLYVVAAVGSQPAAPACPKCAVLSPAVHDPQCDVAVQGGWICEGH